MNKYLLSVSCLLLFASSAIAQITYVNSMAVGANNGTSWQDAYTSLTMAFANTINGDIWVAKGIYKPTSDTNRDASFALKPGINLYGGFPEEGNPTWFDRDWEVHPTVLSGDIGIAGDTSDNSFHIMALSSWSPFDVTVDGFTFTGGNSDYEAGAMDISGLFDFDSKITVRNCNFHHNYASYSGGAISASWTTLLVENSLFEENYAGNESGAIEYFSDHFSTDEVRLVCKNSIFKDNYAGYSGGASSTRGYNSWYNCLFQGNYADYEGAVLSHFRDGVVEAVNCTFIDNLTQGSGSVLDIFSWEDSVVVGAKISNSILLGNTGETLITVGGVVEDVSLQHSLLDQGFCPLGVFCGPNVLFNGAPEFIGPDDPDLGAGSPCVNAGENMLLPVEIDIDLEGNPRIIDGIVDMGAYEFTGTLATSDENVTEPFIFPNPASDVIFIQTDGRPYKASFFNAQGQQLLNWLSSDAIFSKQELKNIPSGLYFIGIDMGSGHQFIKKIVVH